MKKTIITTIFIASSALLLSCGGSGSSRTSNIYMTNSFGYFKEIMTDSEIQKCIGANPTQTTCNCPGGGQVTVDEANLTVSVDACKSSTEYSFDGTITMDQANNNFIFNLTSFGECNNATGNNLMDQCNGTIRASCATNETTCTIIADSDNPDQCVLDC